MMGSIVSRWRTILIVAVYACLAVVMTWPMSLQLNSHLFGRGSDAWSHYWIFLWIRESLVNWHSPFFTDLLYYPNGVYLYTQNIAWINIGLWLILQLFVTDLAAYNLAFMAVYWMNAVAMFFLICDLLQEDDRLRNCAILAAFVGGMIYGFWPYILRHSFHPNLSFVAAIPLSLLFLRRMLRNGRSQEILLTGVFIALIGITRWQLLIMSVFLLGAYVLYEFIISKAVRTWQTVRHLIWVGVIAVGLMLPFATPLARYQLSRDYPEDIFLDEHENTQTDLLAFILPSHAHPLWGESVAPLYEVMPENFSYTPFIGYVTLLLALFGLVMGWPKTRFWLLMALLFLVLALGPVLQINGRQYPTIPMPYNLIGDFDLIRILRNPDRFNVMFGIPIAILAAFGAADLLRDRTKWKKMVFVSFISLLILFEYSHYPFPSQDTTISSWYSEQLTNESGDFGILELPLQPRGADKQHMFYQTQHLKPIAGGHISRIPREAYGFISSNDLLNSLASKRAVPPDIVAVTQQLKDLSESGFRYLVIDKLEIPSDYRENLQAWITIEPIHEDEYIVVYRTDPQAGMDFEITQKLTAQIGLIHSGFTPPSQPQGAEISIDVRWGTTAVPEKAYDVCFDLVDVNGRSAQNSCEPLIPSWPTNKWGTNEVVNSNHNLAISPYLLPGTYTLALSLLDPSNGKSDGQSADIGAIDVESQPREFSLPSPENKVAVNWNEDLYLHGYDLVQDVDSLSLTVYWHALQRMDTDYTVFVHLLDEQGNVAVQDDAIPRRWTYPTIWWEKDEIIVDTIPFNLENIEQGQYTLTLGLYDVKTGERFVPVLEGDGQILDTVVLISTIHR